MHPEQQIHFVPPGVSGIQQALPKARHLPGDIYSSPEIYRREMDEYFYKEWLFMGRVEEFPNPGDYRAKRVLEQPVLIVRNAAGELQAFLNMCRHRGVEVASGSGNTKLFKCPYHGWTYDTDGKLTGAAFMRDTEGFDTANCRLPKVHLDTWRGNIFINFAQDPKPLKEALAEFEGDFALLRTEEMRLAHVATIDLQCNWKFFHENLMDFYHVRTLHSKSFGRFFDWTPENVSLKDNGGITIRYEAAPSTPQGKTLFGKAPWLENRGMEFACTGYLPPNLTLFGRIDCAKIMCAWPTGIDSCHIEIHLLMPAPFFSDPDFEQKLKVYVDYQAVIYEEDRMMIESMQKAMALPRYEPGRLSVMEKPIHHFLSRYTERMFGPQAKAG
jgi:Rieske 2Fe-2S family protein